MASVEITGWSPRELAHLLGWMRYVQANAAWELTPEKLRQMPEDKLQEWLRDSSYLQAAISKMEAPR